MRTHATGSRGRHRKPSTTEPETIGGRARTMYVCEKFNFDLPPLAGFRILCARARNTRTASDTRAATLICFEHQRQHIIFYWVIIVRVSGRTYVTAILFQARRNVTEYSSEKNILSKTHEGGIKIFCRDSFKYVWVILLLQLIQSHQSTAVCSVGS